LQQQQLTVVMPDGRRFGPTDIDTIKAWVADGRVPPEASLVDERTGDTKAIRHVPELAALAPGPANDPMSTVIPYRNGAALLSYYMGVFSLIALFPFFGLIGIAMAAVAVIAGVIGLKRAKADRRAKGRVHCWIGLVCGVLFGLLGLGINAVLIVVFLLAP
jgi:hypothetical protein